MENFKKIYIEVTNICNLSCSFCHLSKRPQAFMGSANFEAVLKKLHGHTRYIYLHVLGEAMLHPELKLLLEISLQHGMQVNLSSNGTLLEEKGELLLEAKALRQINISLHSFERANTAELDDYLGGILAFVARVQEEKSSLLLNLRLWNIQEISSSLVGKLDSEILRRLQEFFKLPDGFASGLAPGRSFTVAPGIFLGQERQFNWPHHASDIFSRKGTCRGLRDHVAILVDGTVVPCCLDAEADIPLGNIHQQSLGQILDGPRASRLLDGFNQQKLVESLCQRCNFRSRFQ